MSVSVVIPAYRAARTIGRALDSVLGQSRPPDEILVVDDGSPDDLGAALRPYGNRVTLLRKPNGGASSARNLGIDRCRGEWVAFLDADDYWEPQKLARQLAFSERYPQVGLVATRYYLEPPGGERRPPRNEPPLLLDQVVRPSGARIVDVAAQVWTSTVLVRRTVLGDERFDTTLVTAEDRDMWIRLVAACPSCILGDRLATCVLEPGSLSRSYSSDGDSANMLRVVRRHRALLGRRGLRASEAWVFRLLAGIHLGAHRPRAAVAPAWHRLCRQPLSPEGWWVLAKSVLWSCARAVKQARRAAPAGSVPLTSAARGKESA